MADVGFIGLGVMGTPMARNLMKGGHSVRGFDLDRAAVDRLVGNGGRAVRSPAEAADGADFIITMLPQGAHVEAALFGDNGAARTLSPEALFIDMSTILPADTDRIAARLKEMDIAMVDAPVGRSSQHAEEGTLLIMAGGTEADVARARPILELMGDPVVHCGPGGAGARTKVVNNYLSIALDVLTAESLTLAERSGLDRGVAIDVMKQTVAGMGHLGTTYPAKVLKGDVTPGFMIDHAHKDLGLALELGAGLDTPLFLGSAARQMLSIARAEGRGGQDWTAVLETVRGLAQGRGSG